MTSTFARKQSNEGLAPLDPHKYVKYTLGMLLGVDEFTQEHAYLSGYDHWLARELLGYGTTSGLHVYLDGATGTPSILVNPGVAISPRGQLIRVMPAQCADLNAWLEANKELIGNSPPNPLTAYVVLSYRACPTDDVPIPGQPCDREEEALVSARLSDDFTLEISLKAPNQREEDALQAFVAWLRQVQVTNQTNDADGATDGEEGAAPLPQDEYQNNKSDDDQVQGNFQFSTPEQFADALLGAATNSDLSDPSSFMATPPPPDLLIPAAKVCEYWKIAFRTWVTQLRPQWRAYCSRGDVPDEDRVLLAQLTIPLTQSPEGNWRVSVAEDGCHTVIIDEKNRPFLLHLRLLQEWMLCNPSSLPSPAYPHDDNQNDSKDDTNIQSLHNKSISDVPPSVGQVLMFTGKEWQPSDLTLGNRNFVEHPFSLGRYRIAAAGYVKCNATGQQPSYNGLAALATQDGTVNVGFTNYQWPHPAPYIVKVLSSWHSKIGPCIVSFDHFTVSYFILRVTDSSGKLVSKEDLEQLELMIEVSQYIVGASPEKKSQTGHTPALQKQ